MNTFDQIMERLCTNEEEEQFIHWVTEGDLEKVMDAVIKHGMDPNTRNYRGWSGLREAAIQGHYDIAQFLLDKGADVDAKNATGWTAMMMACVHGHMDIVRLLISKGADVNAKNINCWTALMSACYNGHRFIVRYLIEHGANVNFCCKHGKTALMLSVEKGFATIVSILIAAGADLNIEDTSGLFDGDTALRLARRFNHEQIEEMLIRAGAKDPDEDKKE